MAEFGWTTDGKRMSWDQAKALDEANRKAQRDAERDRLLIEIGEMAVRSNDLSCDLCLHCMSEGSDDDPHDWDCPQPLIDRFHEEGFELRPVTPEGDTPKESATRCMTRCSHCGESFPSDEETEEDVCPRCGIEGCLGLRTEITPTEGD